MKLLLFSDLHLDAQFAWLAGKPTVARARRLAVRSTFENIVRLATQEGVDAVLCGGDLFEHARVTQDTCNFVRTQLAALHPIPVFISPGNHDYLSSASPYLQSGLAPNVRVFENDRLEPVQLLDGITLWGAAHLTPAYTDNFLEGFSVDRQGLNLALFHGSESFMVREEHDKLPYAPFQSQEITNAGLQHVFLGHIHTPKEKELLTYPGNPEPLTFGESGVRGAVLIDILANGEIRRKWHKVSVGQVSDIALDITDCASGSDVRDRLLQQSGHLTGLLRVTFHGVLNSDVELHGPDLESAVAGADAVVIRLGDLRSSYDIDTIGQETSVRGRFVSDVMAAGLPPDEAQRVIVTGLRALEGRTDLEVA